MRNIVLQQQHEYDDVEKRVIFAVSDAKSEKGKLLWGNKENSLYGFLQPLYCVESIYMHDSSSSFLYSMFCSEYKWKKNRSQRVYLWHLWRHLEHFVLNLNSWCVCRTHLHEHRMHEKDDVENENIVHVALTLFSMSKPEISLFFPLGRVQHSKTVVCLATLCLIQFRCCDLVVFRSSRWVDVDVVRWRTAGHPESSRDLMSRRWWMLMAFSSHSFSSLSCGVIMLDHRMPISGRARKWAEKTLRKNSPHSRALLRFKHFFLRFNLNPHAATAMLRAANTTP